MAAGLSIKEENVEEFRRRLNENCTLTEKDLAPKILIDVPMPVSYINKELVEEISLLEPFGKGNTKPIFAQKGLRVLSSRILGKNRNEMCIRDRCVYKRLSGCGSGTEYLAVTPWGDFYPCHQFVGEEQYLMGNVDEGITKPEIVKDFGRCNVYTKPDCKDCFARFYCSGGCAANGYHFGGDIRGNYKIGCELQRKRVECAIMIKAALAE